MSDSGPETFGRYTLLEPIAEGGMGEVWKARAESGLGLGKIVALKRIAERLGDDPDFVAMFVEEARISLALSHPNIVQVFDAGREGRRLFLAMEHIEGKNLHDVIQKHLTARGGPLPERAALTIAAEVARALDHAHRRRGADGRRLGVVHRDVSPGNVLCAFEGDVKLSDFGLAKATIRAYQSLYGTIKGKAAYMAPEQARAEPVDVRTDVFGLGAVMFEMLTGEGPYAGAGNERDMMEAARRGKHPSLATKRPDLSPDLAAIVDRALRGKPEARFSSADELRRAIEDYAARAGHVLSASDLAGWMTELFDVAHETIPPHPFARALGAGLGLGAGPSSLSVSGPTARLGAEAQADLAAALARTPRRVGPPAAASIEPARRSEDSEARPRGSAVGSVGNSDEHGGPSASSAVEPPDTEVIRRSRRPWPVVLVVAALVIVGVVTAVVRGSSSPVVTTSTPARPEQSARVPAVPGGRPSLPPANPAPPPTTGPSSPIERRRSRAASAEPASIAPVALPRAAADPPVPVSIAPAVLPAAAPAHEDAVVSFLSHPWAEVSVDGKPLCRASVTSQRGCRLQKLAPGRHEVVFHNAAADQCARRIVVLEAGSNPDLRVDLEPCRPAP